MASFSMSVQTAKALIDATAWKARSHSVSYGAIPSIRHINVARNQTDQAVAGNVNGVHQRIFDAVQLAQRS